MASIFSLLFSRIFPGVNNYSSKAEAIVDEIVEAHSTLVGLPDLRPSETVNTTLGNLVSLCIRVYDSRTTETVLNSPRIQNILPSLRQICSDAESCLEHHWAVRITIADDEPEAIRRLHQFPYFDNYEELARLELCALSATNAGQLPTHIAFLGAGPLPLTSLSILKKLRQDNVNDIHSFTSPPPSPKSSTITQAPVVLNVDRDHQACAAAKALCARLGEGGRGMNFVCEDAGSAGEDLMEFDSVFLAALVGTTQEEKEDIIIGVAGKMRPSAHLVIRSAWGLRTCLYPEVDLTTEKMQTVLDILAIVHPYGKVVNSVIITRVKEPDEK
ncbi:Nicotianamine synthase [Xylariaceae sp. FL1019]|nr:Nicotianamine synthase [Xylariaceae sp. FL1019]